MSLKDKIDTDYKNILKSKDKIQISTYRLILSGIKDLDISNRSGPNKKNTDDEDNFFDKLYCDFEVNRVLARRAINSNGKGRGEIFEILVTNYEVDKDES